jgi:ASC-1-like (ASCH) protein
MSIIYNESLSEPWFSLIFLGLKIIEGRKNKGRFKNMNVGDIVVWTNEDFNFRSIMTKIIRKTEYLTFKEYLENEGLEKCLPSITNIEDGLSVYFKYFTKEDEFKYGVVAFEIERI